MRVLVACEYSGTVRDAFLARGHEALSCDILPTDTPGPHYQGDVRDILHDKWDLLIAHPPCTYLCNSGVRWLANNPERYEKMLDGAAFFRMLLDAPIAMRCVENPIMHKYAKNVINAEQTQTIHPYQFGHMEKKATCLWLRGLPALQPTTDLKKQTNELPKKLCQRIEWAALGPNRWKIRSTTFRGIAEAMAAQWG